MKLEKMSKDELVAIQYAAGRVAKEVDKMFPNRQTHHVRWNAAFNLRMNAFVQKELGIHRWSAEELLEYRDGCS